jgi:hypothetical protein
MFLAPCRNGKKDSGLKEQPGLLVFASHDPWSILGEIKTRPGFD